MNIVAGDRVANSSVLRNVTRATHVAIIMDGNGRWAKTRGLRRLMGHKRGVETVRQVVKACPDLGITHLTLYAFSTENWKRSASEVSGLMRLLRSYILKELSSLVERGIRLRFVGRRSRVDADLQALMRAAEKSTAGGQQMNLTIAIDYGSRDELARAARAIAIRVAAGELSPLDVIEDVIEAHLDTAGLPDPDLVIRTSGECRTSNFLSWQAAYSEYAFVDVNWPDFSPAMLADCLAQFEKRDRRFGALAR